MNGYKSLWKDTERENFPIVTLSTTNPSDASLKLNPVLRGEKLQLTSRDVKDRNAWSHPSTLHTSSPPGSQCNTDYSHQRHFLFVRRAWLQAHRPVDRQLRQQTPELEQRRSMHAVSWLFCRRAAVKSLYY